MLVCASGPSTYFVVSGVKYVRTYLPKVVDAYIYTIELIRYIDTVVVLFRLA